MRCEGGFLRQHDRRAPASTAPLHPLIRSCLRRRAHMQLKLEEATRQLDETRAAHAELSARHEEVTRHYDELRRQCKGVRALLGGALRDPRG